MTNQVSTISLRELISITQKWKKIIHSKFRLVIFVILLGGLIGLLYSYIKKPIYKAVLTFALDEDKGNGGGAITSALGIASQFGLDIGGSGAGGAFSSTNLTELMKSRFIVEKTLLRPIDSNSNLTLIDYYLSKKELKSELEDYSSLENLKFNTNRKSFSIKQDSVLNAVYKQIIKNNLNISQKDRKVTIISLEVFSKNEFFSKKFC